ncbi:MAG: ABC transporter ATP-binding protein/permease [Phycisphaerae bacterium]|nr:ABC transporter ATP-binding protein/permease [Phycisphaerae bacterium]
MKAFNRIFDYIWPQWHRVVLTIGCALIVAILLSVSYLTVIPILKVMIKTEGLHPWIESKVCANLYGIKFNGLTTTISEIDKLSLSFKSGLRQGDLIIGVAPPSDPNLSELSYSTLVQHLANCTEPSITLRIARDSNEVLGERDSLSLALITPHEPNAIKDLGWKWAKRTKWNIEGAVLAKGQQIISHLPRDTSPAGKMKAIILIIEIMLFVTFLRCIAKYFQAYIAEKIVQVTVTNMRQDVFSHILRMPLGYFTNERPSDAMSRIVKDTAEMSHALKIMFGKAIREPMNAVVGLGVAMCLSWQLTLIFMGGTPLVLIIVGQFGKRMKRASRKTLEAGAQMLSKLQESVSGLQVVKVYNQQDNEVSTFQTINNRLLKQQLRISRIASATSPALEIIGMAAACGALIVGARWVTQSSEHINGENFLTLLVVLGASAESARKASDVWNKVQKADAAAERVFYLMDQTLEVDIPNAPLLKTLTRSIEFKDVTFAYPGTTATVLNHINITIHAGETIAVVGPNGSGKSTLASLLPRFYDPDSGQILLDGQDIHAFKLSSLRNQIGMVTQHAVSFNNTVAYNIAYARPDASQEDIIQAAKQAFAHEFIQALPNGYDTIIGERGTGLSGGQLQRIVIARAILKNPAILIFDEATSQVDAESEAKIHSAIEELMVNRTTFIIAHRFSTVVAADQIVVIDKGRVAAKGTHQELIKTCKVYQGLYETQLIQS